MIHLDISYKKVLTYLRRETITLPDISTLIRRMKDEEFIR